MKSFHSRAWSVGTVIAAGLVAWAVAEFTLREEHHHPVSEQNLHDWMHENLKIRPDQEAVLMPIELAFEKEAGRCREEIVEAGIALAEAIRRFPEDSAEIETAQVRLHAAKGLLEEITLEHFFAMKKHLDPDQGEKLLEWTYDSLLHGHHR